MIRHDLSPFVQVESLGVYFRGTSTVFLMLLAAAEPTSSNIPRYSRALQPCSIKNVTARIARSRAIVSDPM
jgi:hypothetical protein